jgi:Ni,Fe-hydrogenase I small subunit
LDGLIFEVFIGELLKKPSQPFLDVVSVWLPKRNNDNATMVWIQMGNGVIEISVRCQECCPMLLGEEEDCMVVSSSLLQLAYIETLVAARGEKLAYRLRKALVNEEPHEIGS